MKKQVVWCFILNFDLLTEHLGTYLNCSLTEKDKVQHPRKNKQGGNVDYYKISSIFSRPKLLFEFLSPPLHEGFLASRVPDNLDAIIIGSGIGGLGLAVLLARVGKKVLVLEQHDRAGGCCHTFTEKGFEFDVGEKKSFLFLTLHTVKYLSISQSFFFQGSTTLATFWTTSPFAACWTS